MELQSIVSESVILKTDEAAEKKGVYIDLSKLDFEKLKVAFAKVPRKNKLVYDLQACWDNNIIKRLKGLLNGNSFTSKKDIIAAFEKGSEIYELIEITLNGKEIALPAEVTFYDKDNNLRSDIRIKWWKVPKNMTWEKYSINIIPELPGFPPESKYDFYRSDEKPVFFGHYWLTGTPELLHPNICCLDYSVANGGQLVAYRKNGEVVLSSDNFVETIADKKEV